ncbi:MAG: hypothetical protein ABR553_03910 [Gammaproteobacteria bacterium]
MQTQLTKWSDAALVLAGLLLLGGCASLERFERDMDGYLGWDIERLRAHFGYAYLERDLGQGLRAFTWSWTEVGVRPGYVGADVVRSYRSAEGATQVVVSPGMYFPPDQYAYSCEFSFIIEASGHAIGWRAHGDGCAAYTGPGPVLRRGVTP